MTQQAHGFYTPKMEEFYFGFEYQCNDFSKWVTATVPQGYLPLIEYGLCKIPFELALAEGLIRVQYLTHHDVADLGWRCQNRNRDFYVFGLKSYELTLFGKSNYYLLKIVDHNRAPENVVYYGKCKNKSRLKFLMRDLGISDD